MLLLGIGFRLEGYYLASTSDLVAIAWGTLPMGVSLLGIASRFGGDALG